MQETLNKKLDIKWLIFPVAIIALILSINSNEQLSSYSPYLIIFLCSMFIWRIYTVIKSPAAIINNNILTIYEFGDKHTIDKSNIQSIEYIEKSRSLHELRIKLNGFEPWVINIKDKRQHINNNRLKLFINEYFWQIIPNK